jgi:hypothetical protein
VDRFCSGPNINALHKYHFGGIGLGGKDYLFKWGIEIGGLDTTNVVGLKIA